VFVGTVEEAAVRGKKYPTPEDLWEAKVTTKR
jgi:hypothetical protein